MKSKTVLFLSLLAAVFVSCQTKKDYFEDSGSMFHTLYHIKYEAERPLSNKIDSVFSKFNLSLNPFNPNSIIAKVNNNDDVEVDDWFTKVFDKAEEVSAKTDGMFDITCAPIVNLWGFGFSNKDSVTPQMVDSLKEFVGYRKVRLENGKVLKDDSRVLLNCSAIAKGFSCDVIAGLLESEGVENYMVEIGGEVMMKGVNPNGADWKIGINKPEDDSTCVRNEIEDIIQLSQKGGIATSGNYRNFYVKDGKKYAHTINPLTGYPAEQNILSATIVADDCMTADAYATAFMVMGLEKAREVKLSVPEIEYYVIYTDESGNHKIEYSPGMKKFLKSSK
jgi:thiamine biosynthesis lipoprotein